MFNTQKKYFKKKIDGVQRMLWDLGFKRYKSEEIREEIRQAYNVLKTKLDNLEEKIKNAKSENLAGLQDKKIIMERDLKRYEDQMKGIDLDIFGSKPTSEYPEGIQGIDQQIDALIELREMIKEYIKIL